MDVFAVRARILEATHLEAALTGVADEIRRLCGAERLTVYRVEPKGTDATLVSVLQSGLERFKEIKLPVSGGSIASHAAATRKAVNIADAYDVRELASFDPAVTFLRAVDQRTGFRTRQVLAVPFPSDTQQALSGVLQVINRAEPGAFPQFAQETATFLADAIAALMERTGSVTELVKLAGHHDPKARGYAAAMLRNFSGAETEKALLGLVRDGYLDVAATAAGSLGQMGCVRAAQSILERMPAGGALLRHPAAQLRAFPDALRQLARRDASAGPLADEAEKRLGSIETGRTNREGEERQQQQRARDEAVERAEAARGARIDALRTQAGDALAEDSPESAARAREELLLEYRERFALIGRLHWAAGGSNPWTPDDTVHLRWICALSEAGHVAADRLLQQVLSRIREPDLPPEAWDELSDSCRRVAWHLCGRELGRRSPNLESVLRWLDRGGEGCADLANAARQVFGSAAPLKDEVEDTLADSFRIAIGDPPRFADRDSCGQPGQFLGDLGKTRLLRARSQVREAIRLLEEASGLGSAVAAEALWFERCGPLRDDGHALAEWLETRPDPNSLRKNAALATGVALEVGRKHLPANFAEAIRWYRAAFRHPPGASDALDGRLCLDVAGELKSWKSKDFAHLERAWLRRGMDCGDPECLERWLEPIAHGKEPATVAEAGVVLECANRIATRATSKSCSYAFAIARRFFDNEPGPDDSTGAKWATAGARLGHPYCRYMLVTYLIDGRGLAPDLPEAQRQLDEWVADEDPPPFKLRLRLADAYAANGNIAAARAILESVAAIGNEQEQAGAREALAKLVPAGS